MVGMEYSKKDALTLVCAHREYGVEFFCVTIKFCDCRIHILIEYWIVQVFWIWYVYSPAVLHFHTHVRVSVIILSGEGFHFAG